tara:strand:+ start:193 stop:999 length:807 start_codon:yes stop_codon:yes gene_type:complete
MSFVDYSKIGILTTVVNFELYKKSSSLFPVGIRKFIIDGTNGMHGLDSILFMMNKMKGQGIDWLIMADEDVLFLNPNAVFELIERMTMGNYTVCGIRDGGHIPHRVQNPYLINTFFYILNYKEVEDIWNVKEILNNNYTIANEFSDDLRHLRGKYDISSLAEPYFCFFLWLRRKGKKFHFLDSNLAFKDDDFTNSVFFEENIILYHTWHARFYNLNEKHTNRINQVFLKTKMINNDDSEFDALIFKDSTYSIKKTIKKWNIKIMNKLR